MDVLGFLKDRTAFIERYYELSSVPLEELIRKIKQEESPYKPVFYNEDGEPAFLEEYFELRTCLDVLGASCVSMLAESLKLYFTTWEKELGICCRKNFKSEFKPKKGAWVNGYRSCFSQVLGLEWDSCPVDFQILEQIIFLRNDTQHPKSISMIEGFHPDYVTKKYAVPFFVNDIEKQMIEKSGDDEEYWPLIGMAVTRENLAEAVLQVNAFGDWLEERFLKFKYRRLRN